MSYAIDLNPRQSTRTLEQAIRQQVPVLIEPRVWGECCYLHGRLEPHGNPVDLDLASVVTVAALSREDAAGQHTSLKSTAGPSPTATPVTVDDVRELVGTYVDVVVHLGEQRYLFSTDVIRVLPAVTPGNQPRMHVSRPPILQVAQRRRYRRIKLSHSAQVDLRWQRDGQQMGGVGWLFNVSGDGMACRTEERIAESLWIGDELEVEFTLAPGDAERFRLKCVLCNKTPTGSLGKVILGLQFQVADPESNKTSQLLRQRLVERAAQLAGTQKGFDF
ncbi:MAG TPA: PilZ domain-containing protein [Phycisphaerae bacterium]|nr:PilZ domain-containing protein [Phycisphaerae bacterium]HQE27612.1 PilZ domain-containing protein [Phycisphaerae bacterium]